MSINQKELRRALGCFPTGVTVVTTMTANGPLGMTANSFASVSLDPPLVLWSPARASSRFAAFEAAEYFTINVLGADQQHLSEHFAKQGLDFTGVDHSAGLGASPLLSGCAASFECMHCARHDGGDHLIVVGEVMHMIHGNVAPLIYHGGAYRTLTGEPQR